MARIVEFIGSPGVGKTTIYKELEANWKKSYNWMPSQYFYPEKILVNDGMPILNFVRQFKDRKRKIDSKAMVEAGQRFVESYSEYVDVCWSNIYCMRTKSINGTDLRFQKITYLHQLIQKIQTLREQKSDKIAIADEGLLHIIPSILYRRETLMKDQEEIEKLLQIMPLPDAVVSIKTDIEENLKRLMQRRKVIPMHKSLMDEQLENFTRTDHQQRTIINNVLQRKDIPFLNIDSTDKIADNVSKIISFVENLG